MPATLAWSDSSTFDETFSGGPPLAVHTVWTFSIPAISDLGPVPTLVLSVAGRTTYIAGVTAADYNFTAQVTVGGVVLPYQARVLGEVYEANGSTPVLPGEKSSTLEANFFQYDFAPGAAVVVEVARRSSGDMQLEGVVTAALVRDFTGLGAGIFVQGAQGRQIYPPPRYVGIPPDPSPLVAPTIVDPAPNGILYLYAADSWSTTDPPLVTAENSPGWEDLVTAAAMGLRSQIGAYAAQSATPDASGYITPHPTVTGVTGVQAAEYFYALDYSGSAVVVPSVSIPSRLATIVG